MRLFQGRTALFLTPGARQAIQHAQALEQARAEGFQLGLSEEATAEVIDEQVQHTRARPVGIDWDDVRRALIHRAVTPPTQAYVDARTEARALCRTLGMDVENERWDQADIGDFIRLAFAQGWIANELRLASIDSSDAIDKAINTPGSVVEQLPGESLNRWTVRAVKQAVAYGVPKEAGRAS